MYERLHREIIYKYWETHHNFPIPSPHDIDWEPSKLAMNRFPVRLKRWLAKFTTGTIGNRHKLHQRDEGTAQCSNCSHHIEKSSHVLLCRNSKTKSNFNLNLKKVKTSLSDNQTLPCLQNTILKILRSWRNSRTINKLDFPSTYGIQNAIEDQNIIGWNNFILGRSSKKWQLVQQKYIKQMNSKRSSLRWTTSIINKFMNVVWDNWNLEIPWFTEKEALTIEHVIKN